MTDGQTSFTNRVTKNKRLGYFFGISYFTYIILSKSEKKKIFIRIYWKRGLQRATTKNTLVLQILSEYLMRVRQTHSF